MPSNNYCQFNDNLFAHSIVMLLGWVIEIITQIITYNENSLFYKMYKDVLTEVYC